MGAHQCHRLGRSMTYAAKQQEEQVLYPFKRCCSQIDTIVMILTYFLKLYILGYVLSLPTSSAGQPAILVYSATAAFRHDSIPVAVQALKDHAQNTNVTIEATENEGALREKNLVRFDAVVFLSNTGEGTCYISESHDPAFAVN
jgi:hypothetical protein